jgi:hypothetical protein
MVRMTLSKVDILLVSALLLVAGCRILHSDFAGADRPPFDDDDSAPRGDDDVGPDDDDADDDDADDDDADDDDATDDDAGDDDATDDDDSAVIVDLCYGGSTLGDILVGDTGFVDADLSLSATTHDGSSCLDDEGFFSFSDPGTSPWPFQVWQITGDAGAFYLFQALSFDFDPYIVVLDETCSCIAWGGTAPGLTLVTFALPDSGAATVLISTGTSDTGNYTLGWE